MRSPTRFSLFCLWNRWMVITVPGRKPVCLLRRANSRKSQQQLAVKKKGEQYFIVPSVELPCGVCGVFHSASQRSQDSTNLPCNCRDTCKTATFTLNLQALAILFSIQTGPEMLFRQHDQLFWRYGIERLVLYGKRDIDKTLFKHFA